LLTIAHTAFAELSYFRETTKRIKDFAVKLSDLPNRIDSVSHLLITFYLLAGSTFTQYLSIKFEFLFLPEQANAAWSDRLGDFR
jgi:hypothetical protein